jgi:GNAT superfamily N-acetyltransferase
VLKLENVVYREEVRAYDRDAVRVLVASSGFFIPEEVAVAVELVEEHLVKGITSGYHFLFAEHADTVVGYTCFGPIPATAVSYDLYWIVVHQRYRGLGLGKILLAHSEHRIAHLGGRRIYVETSSREQYAPTHAFYRVCGYTVEAKLHDYYAPGDSKVIYVKTFAERA